MVTYQIEAQYVDRGGPNHTVVIRRSESTIAIGVGCGRDLAEAIRSARKEVRYRRHAGEFRQNGGT